MSWAWEAQGLQHGSLGWQGGLGLGGEGGTGCLA